MNTEILNRTLAMIDGLKTVCADAGLANDSSEYKIITEAFLYKYLNDRFLHELAALDEFSDCADVKAVEARYVGMDEDDRETVLYELGTVALIRPEWLLSNLFNHKGENDFAKRFDTALTGIAQDNVDIYSVKAGQGRITLFQGCRGSSSRRTDATPSAPPWSAPLWISASTTRCRRDTTSSRRCSNT